MDVVLGVSVTGRVARLAMVGAGAPAGEVLDQYALDLTDGDPATDLANTIVGTYRAVADSGNRVAATRLCLPDPSEAETLRQTVTNAGVQNVEVVTEAEAAVALAHKVGADAALLLADDDTVSLAVIGEDEESTSVLASMPIGSAGVAAACAYVLAQAPDGTQVMLVGQRLDLDSIAAELSSTNSVMVPPDPGFAIARGAAETTDGSGFFPAGAATQMGPAASDATAMAPAARDATQMAPAAGDATQMAPAAGDATQMAPAGGDATQMAPAAPARRRRNAGAGHGARAGRAAAGVLAGGAGLLRDVRRLGRGVRPRAGRRSAVHRGDRAATATDSAHGQCDGVRGDELHDAGRRGRRQHPAGRRLRSAAGARHPVANGAGELPA